MTFEEFVLEWTHRDMEYHERNRTTGLTFAAAAWETATKAEREACAKLCDTVAGGLERAAEADDHKRTAMRMCTWLSYEIRNGGPFFD